MQKFFEKIIELRIYVFVVLALIVIYGFYSFSKVKIDAIPDITNKQVIVNTKTYGMEPSRIEKSITYPIESELYGIPGLVEMRSISKFGLSQIILIFNDQVDIYFARNLVMQRLQTIGNQIPANLKPEIAPLTTGKGILLVITVLFLLLGNFRIGLIIASCLPFCILILISFSNYHFSLYRLYCLDWH